MGIPSHKVSVILTNNGSNIVAAFRGHFCTSSEDEDESRDGDIDQQGESSQIPDKSILSLMYPTLRKKKFIMK